MLYHIAYMIHIEHVTISHDICTPTLVIQILLYDRVLLEVRKCSLGGDVLLREHFVMRTFDGKSEIETQINILSLDGDI